MTFLDVVKIVEMTQRRRLQKGALIFAQTTYVALPPPKLSRGVEFRT